MAATGLKRAPGASRRGLHLGLRLAALALIGVVCIGPPSLPILHALVPAQRAVFRLLMPQFRLDAFGLGPHGAQLKLAAAATTTGYVFMQGEAVEPGLTFTAETPARATLLHVNLILGGLVVLGRGAAAAVARAMGVGVAAALVMAVIAPSVTLAGAQWGVAVAPFSEPSGAALLVGLSDFLLHGGGYALCAAAVWFCIHLARPKARR